MKTAPTPVLPSGGFSLVRTETRRSFYFCRLKRASMGRKSKSFLAEGVPIHGMADKGRGVGRTTEGLVVFVEGTVPGDVADVWVFKQRGGFAEGRLEHLRQPSPQRVAPFCSHFSVCGGCKWQHLDYTAQLAHKQQTVVDAFERIAKVPVGEFLPMLAAPQTTHYRNKLEFAFSNRRWRLTHEMAEAAAEAPQPALGFHRAGAFDKVVDIQTCWLQAEPSNLIRNTARAIALEQGLDFYDMRRQQGFLRHLMLRITTTGEVLALFSFGYSDLPAIERYLDALIERVGQHLTTVVYCINPKLNDSMLDLDTVVYAGKGFVVERLDDLQFKIGPKSFFQTNSTQAKALYDTALSFAGLTGRERVFDLYTGAGSIALYVARHCQQVVGIEEVPEAIADAEENRRLNSIANARFYVGDVKELLTPAFVAQHGQPEVVITDPPRAGMHERAVRFLLQLEAPRLVYISCNPATQARDMQLLAEKYDVQRVQPVDMFPHTHHIESVALLVRR